MEEVVTLDFDLKNSCAGIREKGEEIPSAWAERMVGPTQ